MTLTAAHGAAPYPTGAERTPPVVSTVVIGLEGGGGDAEVLRWTAALAGPLGARVVAVHSMSTFEGIVHDLITHEPSRARAEMLRWCDPLVRAGVRIEVRVVEQSAGHAILDVAGREGAGLIVVGQRTHRGLTNGSLATHLVHRATCPVVVVPPAG
jgi:nucleotide-binding universal stress UspA family protein